MPLTTHWYTESDISTIIQLCNEDHILVHVILPTPVNIHPDTGIPQINFDQFIHISTINQDCSQARSDTMELLK